MHINVRWDLRHFFFLHHVRLSHTLQGIYNSRAPPTKYHTKHGDNLQIPLATKDTSEIEQQTQCLEDSRKLIIF